MVALSLPYILFSLSLPKDVSEIMGVESFVPHTTIRNTAPTSRDGGQYYSPISAADFTTNSVFFFFGAKNSTYH